MRTLNLDPFWRTSIGFDRLFDLVDESLRYQPEDNYPPCNITRTGENTYRISLAVAGFKPEQIGVTVNQNDRLIARIGIRNPPPRQADRFSRSLIANIERDILKPHPQIRRRKPLQHPRRLPIRHSRRAQNNVRRKQQCHRNQQRQHSQHV